MTRLQLIAGVCYPLLVFAGLNLMAPSALAGLAGGVVLLQAVLVWKRWQVREAMGLVFPVALLAAVSLIAGLFDERRAFLFVPAAVNGGLLIVFGRTLRQERSMVEVVARLQGYQLTEDRIAYCRVVTCVWSVFFAANGTICLWLALYGSLAWWTFYTGFLAYVLVGLLFVGEHVCRSWRFRHEKGEVSDPLFLRVFPQRPARP